MANADVVETSHSIFQKKNARHADLERHQKETISTR